MGASALLAKDVHDVVTLLAATAATGAGTTNGSAVRLPRPLNAVVLVLDVSAAATDATDTLDVTVQTMLNGVNWTDVCHFTQVAGNGGAKRYVAKLVGDAAQAMFEVGTALSAGQVRNLFGDEWRVSYTIAQTNAASFTFSVTALVM